jgi:hypothetical protein
MKTRRLAAGVAIAALYVTVAQLSFRGGLAPTRPLYDGTGPPPPYRWVNPPPDLATRNTLPSPGAGTTPIGPKDSPAYNLYTDDGQASIIFPPDGMVLVPGQTSLKVSIKPLDPAKVASPPPSLDYDGNAYDIEGTYQPSGQPIQIPNVVCSLTNANACATVVLRYAFNATKLYRLEGQTWTEVPSQSAGSALQIYGNTNKLGIFVAAGPHVASKKPKSQTGNIIAFAVGLVAILFGTFLARVRASRRRRAREAAKPKRASKQALSKQAPPKSQKPPKEQKPPKPPRQRKAERQRRKEQEEKPWWRD